MSTTPAKRSSSDDQDNGLFKSPLPQSPNRSPHKMARTGSVSPLAGSPKLQSANILKEVPILKARGSNDEILGQRRLSDPAVSNRRSSSFDLTYSPPQSHAVTAAEKKHWNVILENLWQRIQISDLISTQKPVTINSNDDVVKACQILAEHEIISAPVIDTQNHRIVGLFDYRDLAVQVIRAMNSLPDETKRKNLTSLKTLLSNIPAETAADASQHDHFYSVRLTDTLKDAVEFFGKGIHRLCVLDEKGDFRGIVSQSDALKCLAIHLDELLPIVNQHLQTMGLTHNPDVVSLNGGSLVIDALKLMHERGLSSIALVDVGGNLTGSFSMTDIKHLFKAGDLRPLLGPCQQFVNEIRQEHSACNDFKAFMPVFSVTPSNTLGHVISKLVATRTHRMWLTKAANDNHPVGVVTLSDILRVLTPESVKGRWIKFVPAA